MGPSLRYEGWLAIDAQARGRGDPASGETSREAKALPASLIRLAPGFAGARAFQKAYGRTYNGPSSGRPSAGVGAPLRHGLCRRLYELDHGRVARRRVIEDLPPPSPAID